MHTISGDADGLLFQGYWLQEEKFSAHLKCGAPAHVIDAGGEVHLPPYKCADGAGGVIEQC